MTVIDCHCHIYPPAIADRAVQSVSDFYNIEMDVEDGTPEGLLAACAGSPIEHFIVHSVAVRPHNVESINNFIAEQCAAHPEFIGFATIHQDYPDKEREIERAISLGLRGVKLHPDTQQVNLDDPRLMEVYEIIEGRLPLIMHTGDYRYDYSHPRRMKRVLRAFPDLVVDAAHFGGWSIFDLAVEFLEEERCFLDMSSAQAFLGPRRTEELVRIYGTDRLMFGSDFPMWNPTEELRMFTALPFTDNEFDAMLCGNAERFLGFSVERVGAAGDAAGADAAGTDAAGAAGADAAGTDAAGAAEYADGVAGCAAEDAGDVVGAASASDSDGVTSTDGAEERA